MSSASPTSSLPPRYGLITGLYAAVATGCFYGFSVYSKALKARFHLSQSQLSSINTIPYCMGVFSSIIGLASRRMGRRMSLSVGGVVVCSMQILMYILTTTYHETIMPYAQIILPAVAAATFLGVALVTAVAFPTPVKLWPRNRALAIAVCKSFVGLGGAGVTQVYRVRGDPSSTPLDPAPSVHGPACLAPPTDKSPGRGPSPQVLYGTPTEDPEALRCVLLWAGTTALCVLVALICVPTEAHETPPPEPRDALVVVFAEISLLGIVATVTPLAADGPLHTTMVAMLLVLACLPVPLTLFVGGRRSRSRVVSTAPHGRQPLLDGACAEAGAGLLEAVASTRAACGSKLCSANSTTTNTTRVTETTAPQASTHNEVGAAALGDGATDALAPTESTQIGCTESAQQLSLTQMLRTADTWLLFAIASTAHGGGCLIVTQLAFILQAAGAPDDLLTTAVTTLNTGNLFGRLFAPGLSNLLVRRSLPRPSFLVCIMILMAVAQSGLLWAASGSLPRGSAVQSAVFVVSATLGGLAFGAVWPMIVVLTSELFGSTHLEANYMLFDGGAGFIGAFVLAGLMPSYIYDHAEAQQNRTAVWSTVGHAPAVPRPSCLGPECFAPAHEILIGLCACGVVAGVTLSIRTKALYRHMRKP